MAEKNSSIRKPPKKLGGAVFPRISLEDAVGFSNKLVSKTHVAPQPSTTIFPGVFGVGPSNTSGQVRASALKQFSLLEGKPTAYSATVLGKTIAASVPEEIASPLREACLKPRIFRLLFDTFQGDTVTLGKLRQQAAAAGVHLDQAENCARLFAESVVFARMGVLSGDTLALNGADHTVDAAEVTESDSVTLDNSDETAPESELDSEEEKEFPKRDENHRSPSPIRSAIQVTVSLDSSLDTDKLEKQLQLLRKYGAI